MVQPELPASAESAKKVLSFNLGSKDIAGIPVESVIETFQISPADILPVPQMPACVLGIYNWRGEMLWMVDLETLLGYNRSLSATSGLMPMAVVMQSEGKTLGLLIENLIDIEWLNPQQQKTPTSALFDPEILPFLEGYFIDEREEVLMCLRPKAVVSSPRLEFPN